MNNRMPTHMKTPAKNPSAKINLAETTSAADSLG